MTICLVYVYLIGLRLLVVWSGVPTFYTLFAYSVKNGIGIKKSFIFFFEIMAKMIYTEKLIFFNLVKSLFQSTKL